MTPGIASTDPETLRAVLEPLLEFAKAKLAAREADWHRFPIHLMATAGIRRKRPEHRDSILDALQQVLEAWPFRFRQDFLHILSGEEEGAYAWLAINAQREKLDSPVQDSLGVLDLGGASMQVTFVPSNGSQVLQHSFPIVLRGSKVNLYSASHLQFGVQEAQRLLQQQVIAHSLIRETVHELRHPCFFRGLNFTEVLIMGEEQAAGDPPLQAHWWGAGDYDRCADRIKDLFDKRTTCFTPPCTFGGRYQPRLGNRPFLAFSTFTWVIEALALPSNETTLLDVENAAKYLCKMEWSTLQVRWSHPSEGFLRSLCFSATYIVVLLNHGLGFDMQATQIEFHSARLEPVSWALGAMLWEVNHRFDAEQPACTPPSDGTCPAASPKMLWPLR